VTWELMADYWPTAAGDPDAAPAEREFGPIWTDKPKHLFSRTRREAGWNTTIHRDVDRALIDDLRAQPGGDMVLGGPDLAATFAGLDLIDEYRIYVHPCLLGDGHRAFRSLTAGRLALSETQRFENGVVLLHYRRADQP
jgi:dihydrofolate reductase